MCKSELSHNNAYIVINYTHCTYIQYYIHTWVGEWQIWLNGARPRCCGKVRARRPYVTFAWRGSCALPPVGPRGGHPRPMCVCSTVCMYNHNYKHLGFVSARDCGRQMPTQLWCARENENKRNICVHIRTRLHVCLIILY